MNTYDINIQYYSNDGRENTTFTVLAPNGIEAVREIMSQISNKTLPDKMLPSMGFEVRCFPRSTPFVLSQYPESLVNTCRPPKR